MSMFVERRLRQPVELVQFAPRLAWLKRPRQRAVIAKSRRCSELAVIEAPNFRSAILLQVRGQVLKDFQRVDGPGFLAPSPVQCLEQPKPVSLGTSAKVRQAAQGKASPSTFSTAASCAGGKRPPRTLGGLPQGA